MKASSFVATAFALLASTSLTAVGCGGTEGTATCSKLNECAKKAGDEFSQTECRDNLVTAREKYETAGCGDEWSAYADCVDAIDFDCSDDFDDKASAECGAEEKKLAKCSSKSGDDDDDTTVSSGTRSGFDSATNQSLCARARDCAEAGSQQFSEDECVRSLSEARDRADTAGCASEYDDYLDCVDGSDQGCNDEAVPESCAAAQQRYTQCLG